MLNHPSDQFVNRIESFVPNVSMDCVVFGYRNEELHVLLLKYRNLEAWALPGGFLSVSEEMEDAVNRVLIERTGLTNIFLTQFHTFSSLSRGWQHDDFSRSVLQSLYSTTPDDEVNKLKLWFEQRFISTGYLALVNADDSNPAPDYLSDRCTWMPVNDLPPLVLDHQMIIERALNHLKVQINFLPIGKSLLPDKFTMSSLQSLYETILDKPLDRSNFQRKILKLGMLIRHEKLMTGAANKAPYLYSFDEQIYEQLLRDGIGFSSL